MYGHQCSQARSLVRARAFRFHEQRVMCALVETRLRFRTKVQREEGQTNGQQDGHNARGTGRLEVMESNKQHYSG